MLCGERRRGADGVSMRPAARARRGKEAHGDQSFQYQRCASLSGDLKLDDIVGLDPTGRADREARLGARRELARGLVVAAHECGLRRGEIGLRKVALAAIGHGELGIAVGRFGLAGKRGAQQRDGLVGRLAERSMRSGPAPA